MDAIRASNEPQAVLADRYRVTQPTISKIKSGKRWRETDPLAPPPNFARWASRITLRITDVRVERVQDISEADAIAEGLHQGFWEYDNGECNLTAKEGFEALWESLHGPGSWDANPWVWAIEFERVKP